MPSGDAPSGGPGGSSFTAGDETVTLDFSAAEITENGETVTLSDLSEGDVVTVTVGSGTAVTAAEIVNVGGGQGGPGGGFGGSGEVTQGDSANTLTEDGTYSGTAYTSTGDDENALRVDGATVTLDGVTVSSTHIRKLLEEGDVETARAFLGHPHVLTQTVGHGRQLGRTIGIPTANLVAPPHVLLPKRGVYAAKITLPDGRAFGGVTNVGVRPTVNNGQDVTVEPWILDFDGDLYGQAIRVEFFRRLRDERKFESLDALRSQIETDAVKTREAYPEMGL